MKEYLVCPKCGGQQEHDLRTGEIADCDVCAEGDMPEEKVSYVCAMCNEPHDKDLVYDHRFRAKLAADAGPRQSGCEYCGKPKFGPWSTVCTAEIGKVNESYCQCMQTFAAPPVPQEAAPRQWKRGASGHYADHLSTHTKPPEDCSTCKAIEAQMATAPDEAMRVAKAVVNFQNPNHIGDDARICFCAECEDARAALIRQAGSERERELREALRDVQIHAFAIPPLLRAKIERLLGGESNAKKNPTPQS